MGAVDKGDLLPLALSCTILKDICKHRRELVPITEYPDGPCRKAYITDVTSDLGRIKWAIDEMKARHDAKWCELVAMTASIPILQWLRDNDFPFCISTVKYAAKNDLLDVLQWSFDLFVDFRWISRNYQAAMGIRLLKWVQCGLENDYEFITEYVSLFDFSSAAQNGHIHILEYLKSFFERMGIMIPHVGIILSLCCCRSQISLAEGK